MGSQSPANISMERWDKGKLITVLRYEGTSPHSQVWQYHSMSLSLPSWPALILSGWKRLSLLSAQTRTGSGSNMPKYSRGRLRGGTEQPVSNKEEPVLILFCSSVVVHPTIPSITFLQAANKIKTYQTVTFICCNLIFSTSSVTVKLSHTSSD